jgi:2-polyprenyl-3-methyl-5-hydroxy-6-metoxy-1,4-benzoquinol methylase
MLANFKRLLRVRGVVYLMTRFGTTGMRRAAMDAVYKSGTWDDLDENISEELVEMVEAHASNGDILDLGCGPDLVARSLASDSFKSYRGIDVSVEAIAIAEKRTTEAVTFMLGDIETLELTQPYDLILFAESIMYIHPARRLKVLKAYAEKLKPQGKLMVTAVQYERLRSIFKLLEENFDVVEDRIFRNRERRVIVVR